jgi:methionyl-tRNA formyltransferase
MRLAIIGQQAFGKSVLDAFLGRGDTVAGVFVAPEPPGARPDPLKAAAEAKGVPVFAPESYSAPETIETLKGLAVDLAVMAYVIKFVPQSFCLVPRLGTIQFHPSLLPLHRGPSAINWAVMVGRTQTGLTIFRPTDGLDEGPVVLQKTVEIGPDDTVGSLYFDKIFPLGVQALVEAADAVLAGRATESQQDESQATYEGWVRAKEAHIDWSQNVALIYNLIRGCNPAPGAWTMAAGRKLQIFDARKRTAGRFADVKGMKPGQVVATTAQGFTVHAQGGFIDVLRCRFDEGPKISGGEAGLAMGTLLGD